MEAQAAFIERLNRAREAGQAVWGGGWAPARYAAAPGRVEVLGNHVDYNGGPVLAAAIDRLTVVVGEASDRARGSLDVLLTDMNTSVPVQFAPGELGDWRNTSGSQHPGDFVRGVAASLIARDKPMRVARFAVASSVPIGVGVSSSAALCVALTLAFCEESPGLKELVLIAQEAEHRAGTPCGTMDQSASAAGGMIRFDGSTLNARQLNPDLEGHAFLLIDSGVKRSLVNSSYPRRVEECRQALASFNAIPGAGFSNLASITAADLSRLARDPDWEADPVLIRRARHVITEVERVNKGEAALIDKDWRLFGQLMTESGQSSATDYDISHAVVEELVQVLIGLPGVLGARMMGGGEGGSLIALIEPDDRDEIRNAAQSAVNHTMQQSGEPRPVYRFDFAPGARQGLIKDLLNS